MSKASYLLPSHILPNAMPAGLGVRLQAILAKAVHHFGGGSVAGAVGMAAVYPLDTIKVRMQSQRGAKEGEKPEYENEVDCLVQVVKSEGVGALYCGLGPQLLGVAPEKVHLSPVGNSWHISSCFLVEALISMQVISR